MRSRVTSGKVEGGEREREGRKEGVSRRRARRERKDSQLSIQASFLNEGELTSQGIGFERILAVVSER